MSLRSIIYGKSAVTLIELLVVLAIVGILIALTASAVQNVRAAAARLDCQNRMRQLALGLHQYAQTQRHLPPGCQSDDSPKHAEPFLSWHVRILPHLEQRSLHDEAIESFRQDKDFRKNPPHRLATLAHPPFGCPADPRTHRAQVIRSLTRGLTSYLGVNGTRASKEDGVLFLNSAVALDSIQDGQSNTLLLGERPPSADMVFGWWYAGWGQDKNGEGDMLLGTRVRNNDRRSPECPIGPHEFGPGRLSNQCDFLHFWSVHSGGANFAFADGSVRFLRYSANDVMPALGTRAGGESVVVPE